MWANGAVAENSVMASTRVEADEHVGDLHGLAGHGPGGREVAVVGPGGGESYQRPDLEAALGAELDQGAAPFLGHLASRPPAVVVGNRIGGFIHDDRNEFAGLRVEDIDQKLVEIKHCILLHHHIVKPGTTRFPLDPTRRRRDDRGKHWLGETRASGDRLYSFGPVTVFSRP